MYGINMSGPVFSQRVSVFLCILFLSSCSTTKKSEFKTAPDLKIPDAWSTQLKTPGPAAQPWIDDFGDTQLKEVMAKAIGKNFDIKANVARMKIAFSSLRITHSNRLPSLSLSGDYSVTSDGVGKKNSISDTFGIGLNLSWEPDLWRRLSDLENADFEAYQSSQADFEALKLSIAINIAKFWFESVEKKMQMNLAKSSLDTFVKNLRIINNGYEKGLFNELDIRLARSDIAGSKNRLEEATESFDKTVRGLQVLLSDYPDTSIPLPDNLAVIKRAVPDVIPSDLLKRRPDLLAARHSLIETNFREKVAETNWLPAFQLSASGRITTPELIDLLDLDRLVVTLLAQASQPLLTGGKLKAEREIARLRVEEQVAKYSQAVLKAFQEVETALAREGFLKRQEEFLNLSRKEARRAEALALERYLAGLNDVLVYLDAQRRTYEAERAFLRVQNQKIQNRLDLYLALGGDFANS